MSPAYMRDCHPITRQLVAAAARDAELDGERAGYLLGVRAGRLAGFCWGLLCGSLLVAASFYLGWTTT